MMRGEGTKVNCIPKIVSIYTLYRYKNKGGELKLI